jgi:Ca-activated chloride channel family protein
MCGRTFLSLSLVAGAVCAAERSPLPSASSTIRVESAVVLVPVVVTDAANRPVLDLPRESFRIFEDKAEQRLLYFGVEEQPVSLGIVFDVSASMKKVSGEARQAVSELIDGANPEDEAFLVTVATEVKPDAGFTRQLGTLAARLSFTGSSGCTALIDGVWQALDRMPGATHARKALVVVSDGLDNYSRHSHGEAMRRLKEADVLVYSVSVRDPGWNDDRALVYGGDRVHVLEDMAAFTGGRFFTVRSARDLPEIAGRIGRLLRSHYVLGYRPATPPDDGRFRRIDVKLAQPPGRPKVIATWRRGYNANVE